MKNEEIIQKINTLLVDEFEVEADQLNPSASIIDALGIDSLDLIDLLVLIEQNFGFKVETEEVAEIKTLQNFYDYIIKRLNGK